MAKPQASTETTQAAPDFELVVVEAFLDHQKGQIIADAETVKALIDSEWQHHVIKKPKQASADPVAG